MRALLHLIHRISLGSNHQAQDEDTDPHARRLGPAPAHALRFGGSYKEARQRMHAS
ncbi:MAG: hypothetical protein RIC85_03905 [Gammaproteobacteria bacterium]